MKRGCLVAIVILSALAAPQVISGQGGAEAVEGERPERSTYVLGPEDQLSIWALGAEEMSDRPVRVDGHGYIDLPLVGRIRAGGLTVEELKIELIRGLRPYVREPEVSISVTESRSQPISVVGAVNSPGVHQLHGRKTLVEVLSMAGGLASDAGAHVKVTRRVEWGRLPLPSAKDDPSGQFSVGEIKVKDLLEAESPADNIAVLPHDVISVPRAELVYVIGEVSKSGGYVLNEKESLTVLQALSMAGGLTPLASAQNAKILRFSPETGNRTEVAVDLRRILAGKSGDLPLGPEDILFVPNSKFRSAGKRAIDTALQLGVGIAIWRR